METALDGEEWCPSCKRYRRYRSHSWSHYLDGRSADGGDECPGWCYCGAKLDEFDAQFCIDCLREEAAAVAEDFAREVN